MYLANINTQVVFCRSQFQSKNFLYLQLLMDMFESDMNHFYEKTPNDPDKKRRVSKQKWTGKAF